MEDSKVALVNILTEVENILPLFATLCPFGAALFIPAVYEISKRARNWLPFLAMLVTASLVFSMAPGIFGGEEYTYLGFHVTSFGYFMGIVTIIVGLAVTAYSASYINHQSLTEPWRNYYHMLTLIFIGGILGTVFSTNLAMIFLFLEISTIVTILLVSFERSGFGTAFEAGYKFYVLSGLGAMFTIISITLIYASTESLDLTSISGSLSGGVSEPLTLLNLGAICAIVGLGLKAGIVPFHAWLPDAHAEAPTPISAILSGVVVKTGAYALFLILFSIYGGISTDKITFILYVLASTSMLFGAFIALTQTDIKRLLAYSTISQMGYIILALSYGSSLGIEGGLFHILNHSAFKVTLFLCAGNLILRTGTRNIRNMGGLVKRMPLTAFSFIVASLAMAGLPPFNGFWSKLMIYYAGFEQNQIILTILAVFASGITLAYVVRMIHAIFFGELPAGHANLDEHIDWTTLPPLALSILCIIIGIFPEVGLIIVRAAAQALVALI